MAVRYGLPDWDLKVAAVQEAHARHRRLSRLRDFSLTFFWGWSGPCSSSFVTMIGKQL